MTDASASSSHPATDGNCSIELDGRAAWLGPGVYFLGVITLLIATLFEGAVVAARAEEFAELFAASVQSSGYSAREYVAHIEWRASSLLLIGTTLGAALVSCHAVFKVRRAWPQVLTLFALALVAAVIVIHLGSGNALLVQVGKLVESKGNADGIAMLTLSIKRVAEVSAGFIGLAAASVVILPGRLDAEGLMRLYERLRMLLFVAAAMFVAAVVTTHTAYNWLIAALELSAFSESPARDLPDQVALQSVAAAGTYLAGAFYTLLLVSVFVPAGGVLVVVARRLATQADQADPERWLRRSGFAPNWRSQALQVASFVAPLASAFASQWTTAGV